MYSIFFLWPSECLIIPIQLGLNDFLWPAIDSLVRNWKKIWTKKKWKLISRSKTISFWTKRVVEVTTKLQFVWCIVAEQRWQWHLRQYRKICRCWRWIIERQILIIIITSVITMKMGNWHMFYYTLIFKCWSSYLSTVSRVYVLCISYTLLNILSVYNIGVQKIMITLKLPAIWRFSQIWFLQIKGIFARF